MANPMLITGLTLSLELKSSTYGGVNAENRYVQFRADVPPGTDGQTLEEALGSSLDVHLLAWESLFGAELAARRIPQEEFNTRLSAIRRRITRIKTFLTTPLTEKEKDNAK